MPCCKGWAWWKQRSRGQEQRLGAEQTQAWSEPQRASVKMQNSRWGLGAGSWRPGSLKLRLSGARCSAKLGAGTQSPGRKRLHQRSDQLRREGKITLWRPGRLPGLLPNRLESRHSAGAWLPHWFSSGTSLERSAGCDSHRYRNSYGGH